MKERDKLRKIKIGFKLRFNYDQEGLLGPTGYKILDLIIRGKSLTKVSQSLGLSYRFVWGYINKIEKRCGMPIVKKRRGSSGGTYIMPCGLVVYYLYDQLSSLIDRVVRSCNSLIEECPLRDTLIVSRDKIFGLLDIPYDLEESSYIVIPPVANSYHENIILKPRILKKRAIGKKIITTVAIFEDTTLKEGKIRVNPIAIGIYKK